MGRRYKQHPRQVQRQEEALQRELERMWLSEPEVEQARGTGAAPESEAFAECETEAELIRAVGLAGLEFSKKIRGKA